MTRQPLAILILTIALLASSALASPKGIKAPKIKIPSFGGSKGGSSSSGSTVGGGRKTFSSGSFGLSGYHPIIVPYPMPYYHSGGIYNGSPDSHGQNPSNLTSQAPSFNRMTMNVQFYQSQPLKSFPTRVVFKNLPAQTRLVHTAEPAFTNLKGLDAGPEAEWDIRWAKIDLKTPNITVNDVSVFQITLNGNETCLTSRAISRVADPNNSTKIDEYRDVGAMPVFDKCNKHGYSRTLFPGDTTAPDGDQAENLDGINPENLSDAAFFDEFAATLWFATDDTSDNQGAFHINSYQGALRELWTCLREDGTLQPCDNGIADLQWSITDLTPQGPKASSS
ncbi:hypothetical protein BJ684DRAFT_16513 [Piptocephalis cylindrospora]|uniref:Uncharacterized protein n=1 Tax=Piptocephalis cylindrospora TaxID=1907219 RepID=A0A4P9Y2H9_9FUNG|nr:hypothetical protein BJ684DRAFT_16513 [Piptocephalis cylindrospora]|eukprot:RKP13047.1 hypothetical protein BJ684DRAFT_16513 [Piptocephalis cylindrospora]